MAWAWPLSFTCPTEREKKKCQNSKEERDYATFIIQRRPSDVKHTRLSLFGENVAAHTRDAVGWRGQNKRKRKKYEYVAGV